MTFTDTCHTQSRYACTRALFVAPPSLLGLIPHLTVVFVAFVAFV